MKLFGVQILLMMKNKILLVLLCLVPLTLFAQNDDLELWSSLKFSKKVNSKFKFELQEQVRWADSLSQYQKNFTELGVKFKALKSHYLGLNLRFVNEFEQDKYMRINADLNSDFKLKNSPISFEQRLRIQQSWDALGKLDKKQLRGKWGVILKTKFLEPFIAHEVFWKLAETNELSKQRSTVGMGWDMIDKLKMKLFLRSQKQYNRKNPEQVKIIGFGLHYKI